MKSCLFCVALLAGATVLVAAESTSVPPIPSTKAPQITLMRAPDVVDPLGLPMTTTPASAIEPETMDSSKLPLPVLRVEGNLPAMTTVDSAATLQTEELPAKPKASKVWIASMFAFGGGTTLDGVSSWHQREANPILSSANGTFAMRGVIIKTALAGVVLVPQLIHKPENATARKVATAVNFADAAVYTAMGVRNYSMH